MSTRILDITKAHEKRFSSLIRTTVLFTENNFVLIKTPQCILIMQKT